MQATSYTAIFMLPQVKFHNTVPAVLDACFRRKHTQSATHFAGSWLLRKFTWGSPRKADNVIVYSQHDAVAHKMQMDNSNFSFMLRPRILSKKRHTSSELWLLVQQRRYVYVRVYIDANMMNTANHHAHSVDTADTLTQCLGIAKWSSNAMRRIHDIVPCY